MPTQRPQQMADDPCLSEADCFQCLPDACFMGSHLPIPNTQCVCVAGGGGGQCVQSARYWGDFTGTVFKTTNHPKFNMHRPKAADNDTKLHIEERMLMVQVGHILFVAITMYTWSNWVNLRQARAQRTRRPLRRGQDCCRGCKFDIQRDSFTQIIPACVSAAISNCKMHNCLSNECCLVH